MIMVREVHKSRTRSDFMVSVYFCFLSFGYYVIMSLFFCHQSIYSSVLRDGRSDEFSRTAALFILLLLSYHVICTIVNFAVLEGVFSKSENVF